MGDATPHDPDVATGETATTVATKALNADPVDIYTIPLGDDPAVIAAFQSIADANRGRLFTVFTAADVVTAVLQGIELPPSEEPPEPPGKPDLAPESDTGRFDNDDFTEDRTPTVRVDAGPGLTVEFALAGGSVVAATEVSPGVYEATMPAESLHFGSNAINVTARNSAGTSAGREPLIIQVAERRQVNLSGEAPQFEYTQPDGTRVSLNLDKRSRADVDVLATGQATEMVKTVLHESVTGRFSVVGLNGLAYVPQIEVLGGSFGAIILSGVRLQGLQVGSSLRLLSVVGQDSVLAGTVNVARDLDSLLAREVSLSGALVVGGNLNRAVLGAAQAGSSIAGGDELGRLKLVRDSTIDVRARRIDSLRARGRLKGQIAVARTLNVLEIAGDSDLAVAARHIGEIHSGGGLAGSYMVRAIDAIFSEGPISASFSGKVRNDDLRAKKERSGAS